MLFLFSGTLQAARAAQYGCSHRSARKTLLAGGGSPFLEVFKSPVDVILRDVLNSHDAGGLVIRLDDLRAPFQL